MRALLIGALAATLVGCSCPLRQQAGVESCTDANGLGCLDRTAASQPIEPKPVSFKTNSAPLEIKPAMAAKTEKPSSAHARHRTHPATKMAKSTTTAAKAEPPTSRSPLPPPALEAGPPATSAAADPTRGNTADSHPPGGAVTNSTSRTMQEQVAAATAVVERMTVATGAPEPKANNSDRPNHPETVQRGDAEKITPALPYTDLLIALVLARPEIKTVSDLTNKTIAIDDRHSASSGNVRTAIVAAGAVEVQLSEGQTKAIERLISGEVPAAVLALVSPAAAEGFPDIAGFKIFRIPLSRRQ
jgi:hypothetical protein